MIRKFFSVFSLVCLVLIGQGTSFAHVQKAAIATIEPNDRTGTIEIVHRFSQHDAEHAAHKFGGTSDSIISSPEVQENFARHVVESFGLATLSGEELELEEIGFEFDRGYIWVYQEAPMIEGLKGLIVRYSALQDMWPEQINTVNVELDGTVQTLSFTGKITQHEVVFSGSKNSNHIHKGSSHSHSH